jgi:uncharacterized membrane protein YuzA (DUF378 family)
MKKMGTVGWIAMVLVLIGALNWGLVGFFSWDLVAAIFGEASTVARIVYALVGVAALYIVITMAMGGGGEKES